MSIVALKPVAGVLGNSDQTHLLAWPDSTTAQLEDGENQKAQAAEIRWIIHIVSPGIRSWCRIPEQRGLHNSALTFLERKLVQMLIRRILLILR